MATIENNMLRNGKVNPQSFIDAIEEKYCDKTNKYFFTSCKQQYIVVMKNTIDRLCGVRFYPDSQSKSAMYYTNELMVVDIIHKLNPNETINEISGTRYAIGKVVNSNPFGEHKEINYYVKIKPAFHSEIYRIENGLWYSWHDNGQMYERGNYIDGKKDGMWITWYKNGGITLEQYLNGKQHGKHVCYHCNGKKIKEGEYVDGKKHGKWTEWYDNGQIKEETEYVKGTKHGKWTHYNDKNDNGKSRYEGEYVNGKQHGKWTTWDRIGKREEKDIKDGECIKLTTWYFSGRIYTEKYTHPKNKTFEITWYDDDNKRVKCKGHYLHGLMDGKWTTWYPSGRIYFKEVYSSGSPCGNIITWYDNDSGKIKSVKKNLG